MITNPVELYFQIRPIAALLQLLVELPEKAEEGEELIQQILQSWNSQQMLYLSQLRQQLQPLLAGKGLGFPPQVESLLVSMQQLPELLLAGLQSLHDFRVEDHDKKPTPTPKVPRPVI